VTLPVCFISYTHDNADEKTLDHFVGQIEKLARGKVAIVRDKENVRLGHSILKHEQILDTCAAVMVLFTPEYKRRIQNRQGGAYREFNTIVGRYADSIEASATIDEDANGVPLPRAVAPFEFIPLLFAGTEATAIPDEVSDSLWRDFSTYRVHRDDNGNLAVPSSTARRHEESFKEISAIFGSIHARTQKKYFEVYGDQLQVLFRETKHEILRRKEDAGNVNEFNEQLFVKTHTYQKVIKQQACIIIGRKGSGKSTIIDHFLHAHGGNGHEVMHVHLKEFEFTTLYTTVFSRPHSTEIGELVVNERFFEVVWLAYIYRLTQKALGLQGNVPGAELRTNWAIFLDVALKVTDYIEKVVDSTAPTASFFAAIADQLGVEALVGSVVGEERLERITFEIENGEKRLLFSLDGFDLRFEDFRNHTLSDIMPEAERAHRTAFEIAWLKGLLRSILDLRSSDLVIRDRMDFCVSIPQDRYMEARELERDDYRFRTMASEIQWSGYELAILIRKRLEFMAGIRTDPNKGPLERLSQVLAHPSILLPQMVEINVGGNKVKVSLFTYVLRHTFWRPRDVLYYVAALLTMDKFLKRTKRVMDEKVLKEVVSLTTLDIIATEFLKEFKKNFTNIEEALKRLRGLDIVTSKSELSERLKGLPFFMDGGTRTVTDATAKIDVLFEIGLLGYEQRERTGTDPMECFIFSDGDKEYKAFSHEEIETLHFVVHPIFTEYLRLNTAKHRIVCVYGDRYLFNNDLRCSL